MYSYIFSGVPCPAPNGSGRRGILSKSTTPVESGFGTNKLTCFSSTLYENGLWLDFADISCDWWKLHNNSIDRQPGIRKYSLTYPYRKEIRTSQCICKTLHLNIRRFYTDNIGSLTSHRWLPHRPDNMRLFHRSRKRIRRKTQLSPRLVATKVCEPHFTSSSCRGQSNSSNLQVWMYFFVLRSHSLCTKVF